ncbi:MAG TPA: hypothetical protein VNL18_07705 [Gemmatimonadales bacterium]|nr:hypothetical protein [Gemmatimonadales bacterium]
MDEPLHRLVPLDPNGVVEVDSTRRILRGVARGMASVRATVATPVGSRDTVFAVQVVVSKVRLFPSLNTPSEPYAGYITLPRLGQVTEFRAAAYDAQGTEIPDVPIVWYSQDSSVARLVGPGVVVAVDEGFTQIRAEVDDVADWAGVAVSQEAAAVRLAPKVDTLRTIARSISYFALVLDSANHVIGGAKPRWSSSDTGVARVNSLGVATATGAGSARIIARVGSAADTATLMVAQVTRYAFVTPPRQTLTAIADTVRFIAEARDSLGFLIPNPTVGWALDDTTIATVSRSGLVTARRNGVTIVTATTAGQSAVATVTVRQELARRRIVEDSLRLNGEGASAPLTIEDLDRNGYVIPGVRSTTLVWRSQFPFVATVDSTGLVTAHGDGTTWIAASVAAQETATDTAIVTVSGAPQELIAFDAPGGVEAIRADGRLRSELIRNADACVYDSRYCPAGTVGEPAWSPDGRHVAVVVWTAARSQSDIFTAQADGSAAVNITRHFSLNEHPTWSPDGSRIVFWSNRVLGGGIFATDADGSNVTLLRGAIGGANELVSPRRPAWSPDGTRIAFDQGCNVYVMNADGTGAVNLTSGTAGCNVSPAWSPDGSQLTFVADREGRNDIWVMNADGSGATNLSKTLTTTYPSDPYSAAVWSPRGSQIVFAAAGSIETCDDYYYYGPYECPGPLRLYVMNRDGSNIRRLTDSPPGYPNYETRPTWRRAVPLVAPQTTSRRKP